MLDRKRNVAKRLAVLEGTMYAGGCDAAMPSVHEMLNIMLATLPIIHCTVHGSTSHLPLSHHLEGSYLVDVHDPGNVIRGYPALTGILHVSAGATAAVEGATASVAESSLASTQRRSMRATTTSSPVNAMDTTAAMGTAAEDSSSSSPLKLTRFATVHDVPETLRLFSHSSVTAMEVRCVSQVDALESFT